MPPPPPPPAARAGVDGIDILITFAPEPEELALIKGHPGPVSELGKADLFILEMSTVPRYKTRLECLKLKSTFQDSFRLAEGEVQLFTNACKEVRTPSPRRPPPFVPPPPRRGCVRKREREREREGARRPACRCWITGGSLSSLWT